MKCIQHFNRKAMLSFEKLHSERVGCIELDGDKCAGILFSTHKAYCRKITVSLELSERQNIVSKFSTNFCNQNSKVG